VNPFLFQYQQYISDQQVSEALNAALTGAPSQGTSRDAGASSQAQHYAAGLRMPSPKHSKQTRSVLNKPSTATSGHRHSGHHGASRHSSHHRASRHSSRHRTSSRRRSLRSSRKRKSESHHSGSPARKSSHRSGTKERAFDLGDDFVEVIFLVTY